MSKKNKTAAVASINTAVDVAVTDHDIAVLKMLETSEANTAPAPVAVQSDAGQATDAPFASLTDSYTDEVKLEMAQKIAKGFDDRSAYEKTKNPNNERIQKTLDKTRAKLAMPSAAAVLLATQVHPDFINRSISEGSRYNVYAADKMADLVRGLRDGALTNKINIAIAKSLFAFKKAGEAFTGEMAKAAACDKVKVTREQQKLLTRHTIDPGTMSTQTSSTMTALISMGIVQNKGTFRAPIYELINSPQTARLEQVLSA